MSHSLQILIVGSGGIGGCIASHLANDGVAFTLICRNPEVTNAWATKKTTLNDHPLLGNALLPKIVRSTEELQTKFDFVLIAVPAHQLELVAEELKTKLKPEARVICLTNGLGEAHLARILGAERVYGAVVSWGARTSSAGHYIQTSKGSFTLGTFDENNSSSEVQKLEQAEAILRIIAPVKRTTNLAGARFTKLAINCAISTLGTVGGTTLGKLLRQRIARRIGLELMAEAVQVAHASGIKLEPIAHLDLERLFRSSHLKGKRLSQHAVLLAIGSKYRRLRSSTLKAMEQGQKPTVDFLNGEVVIRGKNYDVSTPYNCAAVETVWKIAAGELKSGDEALQELEKIALRSGPSTTSELIAQL